MMLLSEHFTLEELCHSDTAVARGINNTPPNSLMPNLNDLAQGLEEVRALLGNKPMHINSGYRCAELNKLVGSKSNSQHTTGCAADFTCAEIGTPHQIVEVIVASDIKYDQVIWEKFPHSEWVHISFSPLDRRQALAIDEHGTHQFA
jgi:zinc D-Ala-D-Ala carboxypeptidase